MRETPKQNDAPQTAPELPHTLAKEYGLSHHMPQPGAEEKSDTESGASATEQIASEQSDTTVPDLKEDEKTEAAVDDIVAKEGDEILNAEDEKRALSGPVPHKQHRSGWAWLGAPFAFWWRHKIFRWFTVLLFLAAVTAVMSIPRTRYKVLNTAGVRSSASIVVFDNTTHLPLKRVTVSIDGQQAQTDKDGKATFTQVLLGGHTLTIDRIAFAPITQHIVIGWGSNPLGTFQLTATGTQYTLQVSDYISGLAISGAEASNNDVSALSDQAGKIVVTVNNADITELALTIAASGYRNESVTMKAGDATVPHIQLVLDRKEVFVSKASGKYDVYAMDLDGANKKAILPGSGSERSTMALVVNSDSSMAALASTRSGLTDKDGFMQTDLTLVNVTTGASNAIEHAAQVQFIDWIGTKLVYRLTMPNVTSDDPQRYRLVSYDTATNTRTQLATANQFNAIISAGGSVYYTVSSTDPNAQLGLFKIQPDGTGKTQLTRDEIWTGLRTTYNTIALQTPANWYSYTIGGVQTTQTTPPASFTNYGFVEDAAGKHALWVDVRDGKGVLLLHDVAANTDKVLQTQDGIAYPVRWLNDSTAMYRVANGGEVADYATSLNGGPARKITDATASYGYSQAF